MKNHKGNIIDIPYIAVIIIIFSISLLIGLHITEEIHEQAVSGQLDENITQSGLDAYKILDKAAAIFLVSAILGVAISAYFIRTHPIWFVFAIFFLAIAILVSAILGNVFHGMTTTAPLNQTAQNLPLTKYTIQHLPKLIVIGAVLIAIAMYSKIREYVGGGIRETA